MTLLQSLARTLLLAGILVSVVAGQQQSDSVAVIVPEFRADVKGFPALLPYKTTARPKVAVVLSGGGSRGAAAIGVFKMLEQHNIPVDLIVGTSIGAIVGGLYASGYSASELEQIMYETNWDELLAFTDEARRRDMFLDQKITEDRSILVLRFSGFEPVLPPALSSGQRLTNFLNMLALQALYKPGKSFDDLKIAFRTVSTDLISGKRVVIDKGDLTEALRASVAVPLLFSPVRRDSMYLLDGGLVSNVPVDVAREWGADIVIGVDMTSPLRPGDKLNAPWEQADQIMGIMMQLSNRLQLQNADIVIRPNLGDLLSSDFTHLRESVRAGEEAADRIMPDLVELYYRSTVQHSSEGSNDVVFRNVTVSATDGALPSSWKVYIDRINTSDSLPESLGRGILNGLYETGDYEDVRMTGERSGGAWSFTFHTIPHPVLREVQFAGNELIPSDTLRTPFLPFLGKHINHLAIRAALEGVAKMYRERGYSLMSVGDIAFDSTDGSALIVINEGLVERRVVRGTVKTKDYVIWRELPFPERSVFRIDDARTGLANIYGTNLFEQVMYQFDKSETGQQLLVIKAQEKNSELLRFGLRVDDERYAQGSIDARDENFLGIGSEMGARLAGGARNLTFLGEFKITRIFDSYFTFSFRGMYDQRDVNYYTDSPKNTASRWERIRSGEYRQFRRGISVAFGTQLQRFGTLTIEGRAERQSIKNLFNAPTDEPSLTISQVKIGTRLDTQDRFPFARSGVVLDMFLESPLLKIPSAVGFTKFSALYESFHTAGRGHTLHPRVQFGFADATIPLTEQFSIGGQNNFFGLREHNARGRQILVASLEYRYQLPLSIFFDTYASVRYDMGTIWTMPEDIRLKDLRHGLGLTLSLDTPIGPVDLSVGRSFYYRGDLLNNPVSFGPFLAYFSLGLAI